MLRSLKAQIKLIRKIFAIILTFGKKELISVGILVLLQGIIQVMGIVSIMPFLALVTNSEQTLESNLAQKLIQIIPFLRPENLILVAGICTITLLVTSSIVNGITDYLKARYAHFTCMRIGTYLLKGYAYKPYIFHLSQNSAELFKRLQNDVNMFMGKILLPSLDACSRIVSVSLIFLSISLVNPISGLFASSIFVFVLGIIFYSFRNKISQGSNERNKLASKRFISAHQLLTGIKPIIIHECRDEFIYRFHDSYKRLAQIDSWLAGLVNIPRYGIEAIIFSILIILILSIKYLGNSIEDFLPFTIFFAFSAYRILPSLQLIFIQLVQIKSNEYAVDTLYQDMNHMNYFMLDKIHKNNHNNAPIQFFNSITFQEINLQYPKSNIFALKNINLIINKGCRVGIIGASGSGKSTFLDVLIGVLTPESGRIFIDKTELTKDNMAEWRKLIGYVPQDIFLLDETVDKNIAFGISDNDIIKNQIIESAEIAQIHDYITTQLPHGYDTHCGERGVRLSGGQRQRIALARALYHQPSVLVFDEATSALDNETERKLIAEIEELPNDLTIIMVAHRLSTVKNCDVIYVMNQGEIIESGTYEELSSDSLTFQQLAGKTK